LDQEKPGNPEVERPRFLPILSRTALKNGILFFSRRVPITNSAHKLGQIGWDNIALGIRDFRQKKKYH
jgi:hypothetical protein